jgi:hypothetical protein
MFEAGNIEMALAEELEALTLAEEAEEEQKEIEKRAKAEKDNKDNDQGEGKAHEKEDIENILKDTHDNHHVPRDLDLGEASKSHSNNGATDTEAGAKDDVDAITDRLQATEISSSEKDSAPNTDNKSS